jgi:hypothetical protein
LPELVRQLEFLALTIHGFATLTQLVEFQSVFQAAFSKLLWRAASDRLPPLSGA